MKKLEKLRLQDEAISPSEQIKMKGGDGYVTIDGFTAWSTDDAYCTPGFLTNINDLRGMADYYYEKASGSSMISDACQLMPTVIAEPISWFMSAFSNDDYSFSHDLVNSIDELQRIESNWDSNRFRFDDNGSVVRIFDLSTGQVVTQFSY